MVMKIVNNWPKMTFFDQNMDSNEMGFLIESPTCFCFHKIATRFPANPLVLSSIRANKFLFFFFRQTWRFYYLFVPRKKFTETWDIQNKKNRYYYFQKKLSIYLKVKRRSRVCTCKLWQREEKRLKRRWILRTEKWIRRIMCWRLLNEFCWEMYK